MFIIARRRATSCIDRECLIEEGRELGVGQHRLLDDYADRLARFEVGCWAYRPPAWPAPLGHQRLVQPNGVKPHAHSDHRPFLVVIRVRAQCDGVRGPAVSVLVQRVVTRSAIRVAMVIA
ncbi:hypothetical protein [Mycobacterium paraseoulense]|uniref:hypothetical protein n=1 Tax=Mycobacterium paraseoulense TaxID=590652 RepID=UPI00114DFDB9|nr:hypothetical protein [Mycobacterium paraseoulense]MCV7397709.1 hypothetical protein [Mycobacterium paraseoulense]